MTRKHPRHKKRVLATSFRPTLSAREASLGDVPKAVEPLFAGIEHHATPDFGLLFYVLTTLCVRTYGSHRIANGRQHPKNHLKPALRNIFSLSQFALTFVIADHNREFQRNAFMQSSFFLPVPFYGLLRGYSFFRAGDYFRSASRVGVCLR